MMLSCIGMRPEWNLLLHNHQALKILNRNGKIAVWLSDFAPIVKSCGNRRFLLRNTLIFLAATTRARWCAIWYDITTAGAGCSDTTLSLVCLVRRLVIAKSQVWRVLPTMFCNGIFCLNTLLLSCQLTSSLAVFCSSCNDRDFVVATILQMYFFTGVFDQRTCACCFFSSALTCCVRKASHHH